MNIKIQIIGIIVSFIYGLFIKLMALLNNKYNNTNNYIIKGLLDLLFNFNLTILYIIIIYKINGGVFHLYFFLIMLGGYLVSNKCVKLFKFRHRH